MRTPKSLLALAEPFGGTVDILTFRDGRNDSYHTGFAVVDQEGNELLTCEPLANGAVRRREGADRWMIINRCGAGISYVRSLRGLKADIKAMHTGFRFGRNNLI